MIRILAFVGTYLFCSLLLIAQKQNQKVYVTAFDKLEAQQASITKREYKALIKQANKLLSRDVFSVVHKTGVPPSKTKHDYMSIGPYWWPNPNTKDGLPYLRKDGEINPETRNSYTDIVEKSNFISAVKTLTRAYFFSADEKYAEKNIAFIKAWFVNDNTKMNPNLKYGQSVPGRYEGRCFGIIEFGDIVEVIKFLEIAKCKGILDSKTEQAMVSWFTAYSSWLQNSELGKEEATRKNNHGTHYDAQLLNILIYLNRIEEVKTYLSTITKARIFSQIEPNGSQPLELARTKSFSYSAMNLHGFLELAVISKKVGVNLWEMSSEDGRSIKAGYQYMIPYLTNKKKWEHKQIKSRKHAEEKLVADLKYIKKYFKEHAFDDTLKQINQKNKIKD
ncbi:alginate lyase family protein [Hyunsoonleella pacifica]|uniref:Alginate lyase domain-containing protein n=1 Tax=Hyunsoonleella pacifica TaxID=1080224 RepID=A0A4V2JBC7_9FLAO|nr:alginate lyase family protein [Hyunsoonleella pacifica]TBN18781.1 hypothetical protein EYD46_01570 [Hyunsoonleella pacifica]GGD04679.1 hypothetical protein GCM10011368_03150 [Hyunsoonleella pacifica]